MAELVNRAMQYINRVEPAPTADGPAPLLIGLDERYKDIELVTFWTPARGAPKLLDLDKWRIVPSRTERRLVHRRHRIQHECQ
jgi:hypothetical protein